MNVYPVPNKFYINLTLLFQKCNSGSDLESHLITKFENLNFSILSTLEILSFARTTFEEHLAYHIISQIYFWESIKYSNKIKLWT